MPFFCSLFTKVLDSWGRIPSGLLDGSWINLGAFSECMSSTDNRYCLLFANMPLVPKRDIEGFLFDYGREKFNFTSSVMQHIQPFMHYLRYVNVTSGICVPKACDRNELKLIAQNISNHYRTGMKLDVDMCQTREATNPILLPEIISLSIIGCVLLINLAGIFAPETSVLFKFNFIQNLSKLFSPRRAPPSVPILDGLKALNMFYMLVVHSFFAILYQNFVSLFRFREMMTNPVVLSSLIGPFTIEAFLMITGIETTIFFIQNHKKIPGTLFLILRWTRFIPTIGFMICLYIVLFSNHVRDYFGGPFWNYYHATGSIAKLCPETWWGHLLLIQHYFVMKEDVNLCLTPDWYLETDYIFAILFVLFILPLINRRKESYGIMSAGLMVVLGIIIVGCIMNIFHLQHTWLPGAYQQEKLVKYITHIHIRPWGHLGPYFMGVIFGFALCSKVQPSKVMEIHDPNNLHHYLPTNFLINFQFQALISLLWTVWLFCIVFVGFYEFGTNLNLLKFNYTLSLIYGSFSKVLFAYILGWFIYVAHMGHLGSSVNRFLSGHSFTVLSRINLSAMFINALVYRLRNATFHTNVDASIFDYAFSITLPTMLAIYIISFIFCALIEVPCVNLMKMLFMGEEKKDQFDKNEKQVLPLMVRS